MFTKENLRNYIFGNFEQVDDINPDGDIAPFLDSVIKTLYPEFQELSDDEMRSDNVVEDVLISLEGCNDAEQHKIWRLAEAKYNETSGE
jgi:hypothetical protein